MYKLKGAIFDFNGVLWWDGQLQEQAWKDFSKSVRGTPFSAVEMETHMHGRTNRHALEYLSGKELGKQEIDRLTEQKESAYRKLCLAEGNAFRLAPGAAEFLDHLVEKKAPFTIATASEQNNVRFFFEHLHLARWFSLPNVVYDDGTLKGKPDPDIYLRAASKLHLKPSACMVIEDAKSGIQSAKAAGAGLVVGLGPPKKHRFLRESGADAVVTDFYDVRKRGWL